ncbi:MAG: D-aminoacyl-tRNA deacylase [Bacteroidetes bacterium]|jgi:D-tyrosyl-tRNA(Tyr) deacylase|nr:D-aminoacyl-tRNA deacylase [Bacteroidota bacterium]
MKALIQRVSRASVSVDGAVVGAIGPGLLILLGVHRDDHPAAADDLAARCAVLRIFPDADGKMNRSLREVNGEALVVSQFTLYADTRRGTRPSYTDAAPPDLAERLYESFKSALSRELRGRPVPSGVFGAMMKVDLVNDGPVTVQLECLPGGGRG